MFQKESIIWFPPNSGLVDKDLKGTLRRLTIRESNISPVYLTTSSDDYETNYQNDLTNKFRQEKAENCMKAFNILRKMPYTELFS